MSNQSPLFSADYLDRKRRELIRLREALRRVAEGAEAEESEIRTDSSLQAQEAEDDGQRLDRLELEGNLVRRDISRLARVQRALEKIEEGTYGLSDLSGERIPQSRLDAMPDAINTVAEQEASEVNH
jgi:DnaK suppressor protein